MVSDRYDIRARIDTNRPLPFTVDHVPVLCEVGFNHEKLSLYAKEVAEKVKERSFFPPDSFGLPSQGRLLDNDPWSDYFNSVQGPFDQEERAELDALRDTAVDEDIPPFL